MGQVNALRRQKAPGREFTGTSWDAEELNSHPELAIDYVVALYMETSAAIYQMYLKYVAPEDIHVYSMCHETAGFFGFFLPLKGAALHWIPPAKAALPPLETTAKGICIHKPTGRSRPYWITQSQRNCHPFGIPARFERSTHK